MAKKRKSRTSGSGAAPDHSGSFGSIASHSTAPTA